MFDPNYSIFSSKLPLFNITTKGLTNTGNICYMNSILQILLYCEPFNRLLKLIEDKSIGNLSKVSPTPLLDATIKFFNEFVDNPINSRTISPETFYMNLINHKKFSHLKWGQQEDAEEFMGYYLDGLNEEFVEAIRKLNTPNDDDADDEDYTRFNDDNDGWNEVGSNNKSISINKAVEVEPTPINFIFGGQFKSVLTIPKSATSNQFKKSITFDPFQNLQLDISEADSIEDAFNNLNNIEKISFKSKHNKELQIKKQTFIDKLPQVLIIHLKRFSFLKEKEVGIEKLRKRVDYSHDLKIPKGVLSNNIKLGGDEELIYRLTGVVYHHGSSAEGGHYTSDVLKKSCNEWVRIDDTLIKSVSEDEVLGGPEENIKNAYILMYERK
ncbi:uncharacterized protein RJT21DRAFT_84205 [Scheffersomyces amazonensis]|uniref:uncharacterized protein n=1 Tax=Scheffersomyces amazonensis TaxID=1078765 RepID=UPI00315CBEA2